MLITIALLNTLVEPTLIGQDLAPPYRTSDTALLIEHLEISDRERREILAQLLRDFSRDWTAGAQSVMRRPKTKSPSDQARWEDTLQALTAANRHLHALRREVLAERAQITDRRADQLTPNDALIQAREEVNDLRLQLARIQMDAHSELNSLMAKDFDHLSTALQEALDENVSALLSDLELAAWVEFTDRIQRRRQLSHGHLRGENLDLDMLVATLHAQLSQTSTDELAPLLSQWREAVDNAIEERQDRLQIFLDAQQSQEKNATTLEAARSLRTARQKVRDCTLLHLDAMADAVSLEEDAERLRKHGMARGFPTLARYDRLITSMRSARQNASEEEAEALSDLIRDHSQRMSHARSEMVRTLLTCDGAETMLAVAMAQSEDGQEFVMELAEIKDASAACAQEIERTHTALKHLMGSAKAAELVHPLTMH